MSRHGVTERLLTVLGVLAISVVLGGSLVSAVGPAQAQTPPTFSFDGGGWGHGVGLSQYGAKGMAEAGRSTSEILAHYYTGTSIATANQPKNVRVHLIDASSIRLSAASSMTLRVPAGRNVPIDVGTEVTLGRSGDQITVSPNPSNPGGNPLRLGGPGRPVVLMLEADCVGCNPVRLSSTGNRYSRGRIQFRVLGERIRAVQNSITMDEYLYGLGEVPSSWPQAALEAQAIAGRSYARNKINTIDRSSRSFDLYSSTFDQVYIGWDKEAGRLGQLWKNAVNATSGQTVNYNGRAIEALYSSSTGGHTENSEYVFITALPYLRGIHDPFDNSDNPFGVWNRTFSQDDLSRWLQRSDDTNVGQVTNLSISGNTGVSGRVDRATATIIGTNGTKSVTGARLRRAINAGISNDGGGLSRQLLSTNFTISVGGVPTGGGASLRNGSVGKGAINVVRQGKNGTVVRGWAIDTGTNRATVDISVFNQNVATAKTGFKRLDIKKLHGGNGRSGWTKIIPKQPAGTSVCVSLRDSNTGGNTFLGCRALR